MTEIDRDFLADTLEEIALLLELKGENPFKVRAYRQGAEIVRSFDGDIVALARAEKLDSIKGLGEALRDKLHQLARYGRLDYHEKLRNEFAPTIFDLFEVQGLGPKKIKTLHDKLGIASIPTLRSACEQGIVAPLPGFGAKTEAKILEALEARDRFVGEFRLGQVAPVAEQLLDLLRQHPAVLRTQAAGSFRRSKETVRDLDFLVATTEPATVTHDFTRFPGVARVLVCGNTKASVVLEPGIQCDLRAVSNSQYPFALQYFTGSKEHNVTLRSRALKQGLSLNEYGFEPASGKSTASIPAVHEEDDIYRALGLDPIPPELRENRGEFEAAETGTLPRLVLLENLRGTFHCHTTASDGRAPLEEMAESALDLGLQYLGIADHSKSSFQANGLDESRLLQQIEQIHALNQSLAPRGFRLFAGSEVDILKDGSLDFDDEMLARLDYCVASVHNVFQLPEKEMTRRICRAMENPHVTMLGHLTGRLLLKRDGYAVDHAKIIDCAAETRTVIELNCNPWRLDMDWRWWHRARDKGVLCSINPDAHHPQHFQYLAFGIRLARKGWLSREHILNTRDTDSVARFLAADKQDR